MVVRATLAGLSRQRREMSEVLDAWRKGIWHQSLYCTISSGSTNKYALEAIQVQDTGILTAAAPSAQDASLASFPNGSVIVGGVTFVSG